MGRVPDARGLRGSELGAFRVVGSHRLGVQGFGSRACGLGSPCFATSLLGGMRAVPSRLLWLEAYDFKALPEEDQALTLFSVLRHPGTADASNENMVTTILTATNITRQAFNNERETIDWRTCLIARLSSPMTHGRKKVGKIPLTRLWTRSLLTPNLPINPEP